MTQPAPEFSRLVPLSRLTGRTTTLDVTAGEAEKAALAVRFGLLSIERLEARLTLRREVDDTVLLDGEIEADVTQPCSITLDPVPAQIASRFRLRYGNDGDDPASLALDEEDGDFEPLVGEAVDVGEAVAQELSLSLPTTPRAAHVDAVMVDGDDAPPAAVGESAFEALGRLQMR